MKVFSSLGTLVVLALLAASCNLLGVDSIICGKPPQIAYVTGTVLGETCPAGTIIQLHDSVGGETITYGFGGANQRTYSHVISTFDDLGQFGDTGTVLSFSYRLDGDGTPRLVKCPEPTQSLIVQRCYTLENLSAGSCSDQ